MYAMKNSLKAIEALRILVRVEESLIDDYQGVAWNAIGF